MPYLISNNWKPVRGLVAKTPVLENPHTGARTQPLEGVTSDDVALGLCIRCLLAVTDLRGVVWRLDTWGWSGEHRRWRRGPQGLLVEATAAQAA